MAAARLESKAKATDKSSRINKRNSVRKKRFKYAEMKEESKRY